MASLSFIAGLTAAFALASTAGLTRLEGNSEPLQGVQQSRAPIGEPVAGISCDAMEGAKMHIHQHLVLIDHGRTVSIPANVGRPMVRSCLYWVHTHTPDGIIHIESPQMRTFTLADFFAVWGQTLSRTQAASMHADKGGALKVWVDGKPYKGDPSKIQLTPHTDVVIEAGPPFPKPPKFTSWGTL
jgi:hypothetical protein